MYRENKFLFEKSRWLPCSQMLKNLFQTQWADIHETWYVASGTLAHHSLSRMALTYFTARSILETLAFTWEKVKAMVLRRIISAEIAERKA